MILTTEQAIQAFNAMQSVNGLGDFIREMSLDDESGHRVLLNQSSDGQVIRISRFDYIQFEEQTEVHKSLSAFAAAYGLSHAM